MLGDATIPQTRAQDSVSNQPGSLKLAKVSFNPAAAFGNDIFALDWIYDDFTRSTNTSVSARHPWLRLH
jgi:hypothetical protein